MKDIWDGTVSSVGPGFLKHLNNRYARADESPAVLCVEIQKECTLFNKTYTLECFYALRARDRLSPDPTLLTLLNTTLVGLRQ
jgi:hypothetical protein